MRTQGGDRVVRRGQLGLGEGCVDHAVAGTAGGGEVAVQTIAFEPTPGPWPAVHLSRDEVVPGQWQAVAAAERAAVVDGIAACLGHARW